MVGGYLHLNKGEEVQNDMLRFASLELISSDYFFGKENGSDNTHFKIKIATTDENIVGIIATNSANNIQHNKYDFLIKATKRKGITTDRVYSVIYRKGNAYGRKGTTSVRSKTTSVDAISLSDIKDTVCDITISVSDFEGIEGDITISSSLINDIEGAGGSFCIYMKKEGNEHNKDIGECVE